MKYEQAYHFLMPKLEQELPVYLTYHNVQHTKDVLQVAENLCEAENIPGSEKELLLTAALFHDAGFIKGHDDHEEQSCEIARQALPAFDYSKEDIDTICDLITATKSDSRPTTLLQKIIYDANLHYLGTPHYFAYANKLYIEYKHQNLVRDREDWHKKQVSFLEGHEFMTRSAIRKYSLLQKQNLQLLTYKKKIFKEA
jgi:predicted metal-dependent HD superfamily phosphohydrolase